MTMRHTNAGYEPNSVIDVTGRFFPIVDLTHIDEDANSHMSDIPLQLLVSSHFAFHNSALVTF